MPEADQNIARHANTALTMDQKAELIRARTMEIIQTASLDTLRVSRPHHVERAEQATSSLDYKAPLTITLAGTQALNDQAEAGIEFMTALQQGPGQEALTAVDAFQRDLRARLKPMQTRLDKRAGKGPIARLFSPIAKAVSKTSVGKLVSGTVDKATALLETTPTDPLRREIDALAADDQALADIVQQTTQDVIKLRRLLATSKHVPELIQSRIQSVMDGHAETADQLFVTLVALNEYQKKLEQDTVPELEVKALSPTATIDDVDNFRAAQNALKLLEERRTGLKEEILSSVLLRGMAAEMAQMNASSAIKMATLEGVALPRTLSMLGTQALLQRSSELAVTTRITHLIVAAASQATADGFKRVLDQTKQADNAQLTAADAVVKATEATLTAIDDFRTHESGLIGQHKRAQANLAAAIGKLSSAAARYSALQPKEQQLLASQAADRLGERDEGSAARLHAAGPKPEPSP